jgi:hypothetical protein
LSSPCADDRTACFSLSMLLSLFSVGEAGKLVSKSACARGSRAWRLPHRQIMSPFR